MKTVLAFSGGLASTALLWELRYNGHRLDCVYVDHGQAAAGRELTAATYLVQRANQHRKAGQEITLTTVTIRGLSSSPQPTHGQTRRKDFEFWGLQILCCSAAQAVALDAEGLACGTTMASSVNLFAPAWANMVGLLSRNYLAYDAPWTERDVGWVLSRADQRGAPLVETWSCLSAGDRHCGTCRGCVARRRGFAAAGLPDYTLYAGGEEPPTILPFRRPDRPKGAA